ncbi:hypothetical protein Sgou_37680 [Streptomyces gougerotii]|uniref:Uncharacterized protein n=1 Tax=Streptomyces gougerotii TaxID=53448 RepID=A0A8H9HG03_9ACTN|nr:hypothetical protein Sgou_37680 [Streptomyces gougerotii]GGU55853.1 hypothetical protein GCM10010227_06510 [Streptomyces gougerotii]
MSQPRAGALRVARGHLPDHLAERRVRLRRGDRVPRVAAAGHAAVVPPDARPGTGGCPARCRTRAGCADGVRGAAPVPRRTEPCRGFPRPLSARPGEFVRAVRRYASERPGRVGRRRISPSATRRAR